MTKYITVEYFKNLYRHCEDGWIVLRFRNPVDKDLWEHRFVKYPSEIETIPEFLNTFRDWNCFFHIALSSQPNGRRHFISQISSVWVDIDMQSQDYEVKQEIQEKLEDFHPPSFTVNTSSSGNIHLYWVLNAPVRYSNSVHILRINQRLCRYFYGDAMCCDVGFWMRIPGSFNVKYDPPFSLTLTCTPSEYSLGDFERLPSLDLLDEVLFFKYLWKTPVWKK